MRLARQQALIVAGMVIASLTLSAQGPGSNLPNVADIINVGRLSVFSSPRGTTWFLPAAFSSTFKCLEASPGAKSRLCTLIVTNTLEAAEKAKLSQLTDTMGGVVTHFTDVEPFVRKIEESFQGLPAFVNAAPLLLKTLRLGPPNLQYAAITQRLTLDQAAELLAAYGQQGIGNFVSTVTFNSERTSGFVGLRDPSFLIKRLAGLGSDFNYVDLRNAIRGSLDSQILASKNVDRESALVLVEYFVRRECVKPNYSGSYSFRTVPEACLPKPTVIFDETVASIPAVCTASLVLSEAGSVVVKCVTQ